MLGTFARMIGLAVAKAEAEAAIQRLVRRMAIAGITGFLLALAFGFGLAAVTVWLAREVGAIDALLIIAGVALILALIVYGVGAMAGKKRPRRRPIAAPPIAETLADVGAGGTKEAPSGSELGSVAVVALVGFILARQLWRR